MNKTSVKTIIIQGIALALPLAVFAYIIFKVLGIIEKIISPLAKKTGIEGIFGELTLTILAILFMVVVVLALGLLMQLSFVFKSGKIAEEMIFKMFPSLNHLRLMAAEKFDIEDATITWKAVIVEIEGEFMPAYLIEETANLATFSKVKSPGIEAGEITIIRKDKPLSYVEITMKELKHLNKQFGKGYIEILEKKFYQNK